MILEETQGAIHHIIGDVVEGNIPETAMYMHFGMLCEDVGRDTFGVAYEEYGFPTEKERH